MSVTNKDLRPHRAGREHRGTGRCKFSPMCCARCGKKKGLQGVGSESEHSSAMRYVKWPSLLVP